MMVARRRSSMQGDGGGGGIGLKSPASAPASPTSGPFSPVLHPGPLSGPAAAAAAVAAVAAVAAAAAQPGEPPGEPPGAQQGDLEAGGGLASILDGADIGRFDALTASFALPAGLAPAAAGTERLPGAGAAASVAPSPSSKCTPAQHKVADLIAHETVRPRAPQEDAGLCRSNLPRSLHES